MESHMFPVTGTLVTALFRSHVGSNHERVPFAPRHIIARLLGGARRDLAVAEG